MTHDAELPPVWIPDSFNKFKFILRCLDLNWDLAVTEKQDTFIYVLIQKLISGTQTEN